MSPRLGTPRVHLARTDSTNLRARALAIAGAPHGTLVTAAEQTAGRGRQGRSWSAPPGRALLMSLVLRDPPPRLSLIAGVAVAEVAEARDPTGRRVQVKWPNDVLLDGGKLAGILVEGRPQDRWAVLGIGLNLAVELGQLAPELRAGAASLGLAPDALEPALRDTLWALERRLAAPPGEILSALRERDALRGRPVTWDGGPGTGAGTGAGIDGRGRLLVATAEGTIALEAGEVHLTRAWVRGAR